MANTRTTRDFQNYLSVCVFIYPLNNRSVFYFFPLFLPSCCHSQLTENDCWRIIWIYFAGIWTLDLTLRFVHCVLFNVGKNLRLDGKIWNAHGKSDFVSILSCKHDDNDAHLCYQNIYSRLGLMWNINNGYIPIALRKENILAPLNTALYLFWINNHRHFVLLETV